MINGLHFLKWYFWIGLMGALMALGGFVYPLPDFDNAGVVMMGFALFFGGLGESTCHTVQTVVYPAEMTPRGVGALKGTKPIRRWCTSGVILYLAAGACAAFSVYRFVQIP